MDLPPLRPIDGGSFHDFKTGKNEKGEVIVGGKVQRRAVLGAPIPLETTQGSSSSQIVSMEPIGGSIITPVSPTNELTPISSTSGGGLITERECNQRIARALAGAGIPQSSKGLDDYYNVVDGMVKTYEQLEMPGEDEDIAFGPRSGRSKKSPCSQYSNTPYKCLKKGCNYNTNKKHCTGSPMKQKKAPIKQKKSTKKTRYAVVDDNRLGLGYVTAKPTNTFNPDIPVGTVLFPQYPSNSKALPKAPKSPKKTPTNTLSPATKYKKSRLNALSENRTEFTVDGITYKRKNTTSKTFLKRN